MSLARTFDEEDARGKTYYNARILSMKQIIEDFGVALTLVMMAMGMTGSFFSFMYAITL